MIRRAPLQTKCAETAAQAVYDLRDCIPASKRRLWDYLDETARWLTVLGRRFDDVSKLPMSEPPKRDALLALLEFAADYDQTPEEARQELLDAGVDVDGFLARVRAALEKVAAPAREPKGGV